MPAKTCPACRTSPLSAAVVEPGLVGDACGQCGGQWVPADVYFAWAERPSPYMGGDDVPPPAVDSGPAKRCPDCGHFLAHLRVGHGTAYHLDRCGTCGGTWFDAGEWADLRRRAIAPHHACSPAWQAAVTRDERAAAAEAVVRSKLGDDDYAEAQRVKAWIAAHPHRAELVAYLTPDEGLAGKGRGPA